MAYERAEILAGAAVLAMAAGFALYAAHGHRLRAEAESYPLVASFRSVEGVSVGTDVRLAGVKVGTVTELKLNPRPSLPMPRSRCARMWRCRSIPRFSDLLRGPSGRQLRRSPARRRAGNLEPGGRDRGHSGRGQPDHAVDEVRGRRQRRGGRGRDGDAMKALLLSLVLALPAAAQETTGQPAGPEFTESDGRSRCGSWTS